MVLESATNEHAESFPLARYLNLTAVLLTSSLSISFLWPFVGFMVIDFGLTNDRNQVGYYTGQLLSMFYFGRGLSSIVWGFVADRCGRKVVIYVSLICNGMLMFLFGYADNFRDALLLRFLAGLMNGLLPICKAMASEMCLPVHQARGQSFPAVAWLTALVIGPAIGGMLAQPCDVESVAAAGLLHILGLDGIGVFCAKPFLLPCAVGAVLHFLVLPCAFCLPETGKHCTCSSAPIAYTTLQPSASQVIPESIGAENSKDLVAVRHKSDTRHGIDDPKFRVSREISESPSECEQMVTDESQKVAGAVEGSSDNHSDAKDRCFTMLSAQLIAMNCTLVATSNLAESAVFVWCMAETDKGGLSWQAERIGEAYSICGILAVPCQLALVPPLCRHLGEKKALWLSLAITAPTFIVIPQLGLLSPRIDNPAITFIAFSVLMLIRQLLNMLGHLGLSIITNNSVSSMVRGRLQGTMTSVQSILQALVPMVSGSLFAWALNSLPFGSEFVFLLSGLLSVGNCLFALLLPNE